MSSKKHILVVDDDADCRSMLQMILSDHGYEVSQSSNGLEALESISKEQPDLIILDIMMPKMSGHDLASRLKQDDPIWEIPIIFVTAKGPPQETMQGGNANYCISKPFSPKQILSGVEMLLDEGQD